MADRIAVMNQGQIIQLGTGEEIYGEPSTRFVASFIGDADLLPIEGDGARSSDVPNAVPIGFARQDIHAALHESGGSRRLLQYRQTLPSSGVFDRKG
jgi:ABC-type Fe3+/spermidine/putrescine transport system ATPase subunit